MAYTPFEKLSPVIEQWLASHCEHHACECHDDEYHFWIFQRGECGNGIIELINNIDLSQGKDVFAISILPPIAPIASRDEAVSLLSFAEWLNGISIVVKDFGNSGSIALQIKCPLAEITTEKISALWAQLCDASAQLQL